MLQRGAVLTLLEVNNFIAIYNIERNIILWQKNS